MAQVMDPNDIRFAQDSISDCFKTRENILGLFIKLWDGMSPSQLTGKVQPYLLKVGELPGIEGGHWYAQDGNRRLYVLKNIERAGKLPGKQIEVNPTSHIEVYKFSTLNNGTSVRVRNSYRPESKYGPGVEQRINAIIARGSVTQDDRDFAKIPKPSAGAFVASAAVADGVMAEAEEEDFYESDDDGL